MAWTIRNYSKGQIDRAGAVFVNSKSASIEDLDAALTVINNWRACHSYPLQIIKMTLPYACENIDSAALVAQRLKRLPSTAIKLRDNPSMKLSQMQEHRRLPCCHAYYF